MSDWNLGAVRHALTMARERGFAEVELEAEGTSFQAKLGPAARARTSSLSALAEPEGEIQGPMTADITATLVGYYQPSEPPLQPGTQVKKGDIVAVITALGLANDVESQVEGEVVTVLAEAGQSVQYGQPLAQVRLNS